MSKLFGKPSRMLQEHETVFDSNSIGEETILGNKPRGKDDIVRGDDARNQNEVRKQLFVGRPKLVIEFVSR